MAKKTRPRHRIELRLREIGELFNSMDPSPFYHRDLDRDAEDFLESWALDFPQNSRFEIVIHLENMPAQDPSSAISEAIANYFAYKSTVAQRDRRDLLRVGRISLVIGLAFLVLFLSIADLMSSYQSSTLLRLVNQSMLIGGWVAMWRPLQIFLYDWWPIERRRRIYHRLSLANVRVLPSGAIKSLGDHPRSFVQRDRSQRR